MPQSAPLAALLFLLPLLSLLLLGTADDVFVAPNGDDANGEGTLASPYRTMQRAIDACLNGDTIIAAAGIYRSRFPPLRGPIAPAHQPFDPSFQLQGY
jgi:hypothetical protein